MGLIATRVAAHVASIPFPSRSVSRGGEGKRASGSAVIIDRSSSFEFKTSKGTHARHAEKLFRWGNQCDSTQYDVATLAVITGTQSQWKGFERDWKKNLTKHHAPWLHTTDAIALNKPFSKDNGWNAKKVNAFLLDCVTIAAKHIAKQIRPDNPGRAGLYPYTITVILKDFVKARAENPRRGPKTAPEALATQALYRVLDWGENNMGADFYHLFPGLPDLLYQFDC